MPFCTIEIPENTVFSLAAFAEKSHAMISNALQIDIEKCKSQKIAVSEYFVGSGNAQYFRLRLELLQGREKSVLQKLLNDIHTLFVESVQKQNPKSRSRITSEINELNPDLFTVTFTTKT